MYIFLSIHVYIYIYIYIYESITLHYTTLHCIHVCMYVCIYIYICMSICIDMDVCVCTLPVIKRRKGKPPIIGAPNDTVKLFLKSEIVQLVRN